MDLSDSGVLFINNIMYVGNTKPREKKENLTAREPKLPKYPIREKENLAERDEIT